MPVTWWLKRPAYTWFMIRDVTSVFVAGYCFFLLILMARAAGTPDEFRAFFDTLTRPLSVALHLIALAFAVYHSVTFFNLTPRILVVFRGEEKVPEHLIAGVHYAAWAVVSVVLFVIVLVG